MKNINLDKIYSTNYNRTIETANPTSKSQNIDITIYSPNFVNGLTIIQFILRNFKEVKLLIKNEI